MSLECALLLGLIVLAAPTAVAAQPCAASCVSDRSCTFNGIRNVALGDARLAINDACHLVVSNLGDSGEDGFAQVDLPSYAAEVITLFACPNFAESQPGARQTVTFHGDVPGGIFYRKTIENIGGETLEIRPDFSPVGATLYTVTVLDGGNIAGVFRNLPSAAFQMPQGDLEEIN